MARRLVGTDLGLAWSLVSVACTPGCGLPEAVLGRRWLELDLKYLTGDLRMAMRVLPMRSNPNNDNA